MVGIWLSYSRVECSVGFKESSTILYGTVKH